MLTRRGLIKAGGMLLCVLSGCKLNTFSLNLLGTVTRRETVLHGSLEASAQATQQVLTDMGLQVTSTQDSDRIVLVGTTRMGHRFRLNLRRHEIPSTKEVQTRIDIEWDKEPDDQFWLDLLAATGRIQIRTSGSR